MEGEGRGRGGGGRGPSGNLHGNAVHSSTLSNQERRFPIVCKKASMEVLASVTLILTSGSRISPSKHNKDIVKLLSCLWYKHACSRLQDFIFVLIGKENLLAVTQMTNTNIHNGPDPDARHPPPPTHTHTHTRKHVSTPVCRCEDISTPYYILRAT